MQAGLLQHPLLLITVSISVLIIYINIQTSTPLALWLFEAIKAINSYKTFGKSLNLLKISTLSQTPFVTTDIEFQ